VNNNFMRPGQHKNNNNRNRNRNNNNNNNNRRNTGGGGSPNNKVFDSNGPDVKLRGTTQTIAEKYMQMGRDAQSSGDSVAAESYYQHAEHYYRLWAASQPVGQSLVMPRKMGEDEYDEEGEQINNDEDSGAENGNPESPQQVEGAEPFEAGGDPNFSQPLADGQQRNNRNNNRDNRDNHRNNTNRNRWQNRRNDRYDNNGNQDGSVNPAPVDGSAPMAEAAPAPAVAAQEENSGQWEAPSFLQRPTPVVNDDPVAETMPEAEAAAPRRVRAPRKPRADADVAAAPETAQGDE
jgi:hypothetical protein